MQLSHIQLGATDVRPHHRAEVLGQQRRPLARATAYVDGQLEGSTPLTARERSGGFIILACSDLPLAR